MRNGSAGGRGYFSPPRRESHPPYKKCPEMIFYFELLFFKFDVLFVYIDLKYFFLTHSKNICECFFILNVLPQRIDMLQLSLF